MQLIIIEIRHKAQSEGDYKKIYALSNLIHNLPVQMAKDDADFEVIFTDLIEKAKLKAQLYDFIIANIK